MIASLQVQNEAALLYLTLSMWMGRFVVSQCSNCFDFDVGTLGMTPFNQVIKRQMGM